MKIEQMNDVTMPEEMRAEISRLRRHDPMVQQVMDMADYRGLSAEDRYSALSYYALRMLLAAHQQALDDAMTRPIPPILVTPNAEVTRAAPTRGRKSDDI